MENNNERRKYERHPLRRGYVGAGRGNPLRILDISLGGLSFSYEKSSRLSVNEEQLAKMLFSEDELCLDFLPVKTVSDQELEENSEKGLRRCGVCFDTITPAQKRMLQYFIWLNTRPILGERRLHQETV